jgi:hypothetical protein
LMSKLYDFTLGRYFAKKELIKTSPWSVLFHLQKKTA